MRNFSLTADPFTSPCCIYLYMCKILTISCCSWLCLQDVCLEDIFWVLKRSWRADEMTHIPSLSSSFTCSTWWCMLCWWYWFMLFKSPQRCKFLAAPFSANCTVYTAGLLVCLLNVSLQLALNRRWKGDKPRFLRDLITVYFDMIYQIHSGMTLSF